MCVLGVLGENKEDSCFDWFECLESFESVKSEMSTSEVFIPHGYERENG